MALCLPKFLMEFSEQLFLWVLQGTWLSITVDSCLRSKWMYSKCKWGNTYYTLQSSREEYHSIVITELPWCLQWMLPLKTEFMKQQRQALRRTCAFPQCPTACEFLLTESQVTEIPMTLENKDDDNLPLTLKALLVHIYPGSSREALTSAEKGIQHQRFKTQ